MGAQMISIDVEGTTVKEAIKKALLKLGVEREHVDVKVLAEGNKGLFGMKGSKQAKVKVTLKQSSQNVSRETKQS